MGPNKYIHLLFAIGALVVAFLLAKTADWIWGFFAKPNDLIVNGVALALGVAGAIFAYRDDRVFEGAAVVTRELEKVTWPTRKETYAATIVVIVTVSLAAVVLSVFDGVWSFLARTLLQSAG